MPLKKLAGSGANRLGASGNVTLTVDGTAVLSTGNAQTDSFGLVTNPISVGASAANTDTSATIYPTDARGDVVTGVAAAEGTSSTTGSPRATFTRLHWLG